MIPQELETVKDVKNKLDNRLNQAIEMAAHEIMTLVRDRYCRIRHGCLPLDEETIVLRMYNHIRATGYSSTGVR